MKIIIIALMFSEKLIFSAIQSKFIEKIFLHANHNGLSNKEEKKNRQWAFNQWKSLYLLEIFLSYIWTPVSAL